MAHNSQNFDILEEDRFLNVLDNISPRSRLVLRTAGHSMRTGLARVPGIWDEMLNQRGRHLIQRAPFLSWLQRAEETRRATQAAMEQSRVHHLRTLFEHLRRSAPPPPRRVPPIWMRSVFREFSQRAGEARCQRTCLRQIRKHVLQRNDALRSALGRPTNAMIKRECMQTFRAQCLKRRFLENIRSSMGLRERPSGSQGSGVN